MPLSVYAFFIGTKTKLFFPILLLIVFFLIRYHHASSVKLPKEETMEGVFQVVEEKRNYYVLKGDFLFLVYKTDDSLKLGDVLKATVSITLLKKNRMRRILMRKRIIFPNTLLPKEFFTRMNCLVKAIRF